MSNKENNISRSTFLRKTVFGGALLASNPLFSVGAKQAQSADSSGIKIATFAIDATPPIGCQCLMYETANRVDEPLSCRGMVLFIEERPIVLAAVDWVLIGNGGHDLWRMSLAQAAGTSPERVAIHTLHQHNAPKFDTDTENIAMAQNLNTGWATSYTYRTVDRAVKDLTKAIKDPELVTHIGRGSSTVNKFASTRRIWGKDGKVQHVRFTGTKGQPELREYPAGLIDPKVRLVSFWNGDKPLAALSYYATHPQSYYQKESGISSDTVGIARNKRERETGIFHLHFNGAGGNIGAGKYNDESHKMRQILADRLATGMARAFDTTKKSSVTRDQIEWRIYPALLPPEIRSEEGETFTEAQLIERYSNKPTERMARDLTWIHRCNMGRQITLSCLRLGKVAITHMPGELFVEYQLAAQKMREDLFVAMAAYGDAGPGYIGTQASYGRGGYETGKVSRVAPGVEEVLTNGMRELLQAKNVDITPSYFTQQKKQYG